MTTSPNDSKQYTNIYLHKEQNKTKLLISRFLSSKSGIRASNITYFDKSKVLYNICSTFNFVYRLFELTRLMSIILLMIKALLIQSLIAYRWI